MPSSHAQELRTPAAAIPIVHRSLQLRGLAVREISYPANFYQRAHSHAEIGLTLVLAGTIRERAERRSELATALSVVAKPAGLVHADRVGPGGARTLQVAIAPAAAPAELARRTAALGPWRWRHAARGVRELLALLPLVRARGGPRDDELEAALARLVDALAEAPTETPVDVSADAPAGAPEPIADGGARITETAPAPWLRRVKASLDRATEGAPRVDELARRAGRHPVALTRAFRRAYGCNIRTYRKRLRLRRAAAQLVGSGTEPGADLTTIAHRTGYADQAHLCRDVRAATGLTPSALRRAVAAGAPIAAPMVRSVQAGATVRG